LAEVRNNRLDDSSAEMDGGQGLAVRLEEQIILPLDEIDQTLFPQLNRSLEAITRSVGNPQEMKSQIETVLPQIEDILQRLNSVLEAMQRSQSFQEIVNMVISIKNEEQRLKKLAEEKKRAESGLDEIFDQ
jgi:ABC-type transporter Mla subunit MlaD